ncbi:uncharacterized protein LOC117175915 isoform X2 [Belonocnema kinseyi]|nr:uncharacterized protein LOC117175915 isoform X2 [Belonocnema kinseyi]
MDQSRSGGKPNFLGSASPLKGTNKGGFGSAHNAARDGTLPQPNGFPTRVQVEPSPRPESAKRPGTSPLQAASLKESRLEIINRSGRRRLLSLPSNMAGGVWNMGVFNAGTRGTEIVRLHSTEVFSCGTVGVRVRKARRIVPYEEESGGVQRIVNLGLL